jgi:inhibitor of KinA
MEMNTRVPRHHAGKPRAEQCHATRIPAPVNSEPDGGELKTFATVQFDTVADMHYLSGYAAFGWGEPCVKVIAASDSSVLVELGEAVAPDSRAQVLGLFRALQTLADARIRNVHPGYVSLLMDFDPLAMSHKEATAIVKSMETTTAAYPAGSGRTVEIPVCYDSELGPDLEDVANHNGLTASEVVRAHSGADYQVAFLGFTAGFAYLDGMPRSLSTPRLATPRRAVPAGSVGIAGGQTGIYPAETPGGWRLIGRTPLRMFDPKAGQPTLVLPGDHLRFVPISRSECERLARERA